MTLRQLLDEFLLYKKLSGINDNTIGNYDTTISLMLDYIGADLPLEELTHEQVKQYILHLLNQPISKATKSSYIRNDKIFLRWVDAEYGLSFNPQKIKVPKSPKKNVHLYTDDEIVQIFRILTAESEWLVARNRVIVALMLDSGLRQHEVCGIKKADIDRHRMIIKITGKGAKDRMVSLGSLTLYFLDEYISLCPYNHSDFIFYDRRGGRLSCNAIRLFVSKLKAQLPFELSSHKMRHNYATNYCIDNIKKTGQADIYGLGILMGHESIETTKRYEHLAREVIASENRHSHLDTCLGNELILALESG